jgi:hypothetical protein
MLSSAALGLFAATNRTKNSAVPTAARIVIVQRGTNKTNTLVALISDKSTGKQEGSTTNCNGECYLTIYLSSLLVIDSLFLVELWKGWNESKIESNCLVGWSLVNNTHVMDTDIENNYSFSVHGTLFFLVFVLPVNFFSSNESTKSCSCFEYSGPYCGHVVWDVQ